MIKKNVLKIIKERLPLEISIIDETPFEFSDDEIVGILSWIKYFNIHYEKFKKDQLPDILFPIISIRLRMDLGLYHIKNDKEPMKGHFVIYLTQNGKRLDGKIEKQTVKSIINTWKL